MDNLGFIVVTARTAKIAAKKYLASLKAHSLGSTQNEVVIATRIYRAYSLISEIDKVTVSVTSPIVDYIPENHLELDKKAFQEPEMLTG